MGWEQERGRKRQGSSARKRKGARLSAHLGGGTQPGVGPSTGAAKAPNQVIGHAGAKPGQAALRAELCDPETVWTQP